MEVGGIKKLLDRFGFGWILSSTEEIKAVSLSDIEPVPLSGNFDLGFALGEYSIKESAKRKKTKVGDLLHKFKYEQNRHAGVILADLASDLISSQIVLKSSDLMLTIPPSFRSRSFDPVSFIAERIEERTKIRWERDVFLRTRLTKPQKSIWDKELKQWNVFNTFRIAKPLQLEGKTILLIDDIFDSGATLNEISAILREVAAHRVYVLVLARTQFTVKFGSAD